jgi:hypothetical protein
VSGSNVHRYDDGFFSLVFCIVSIRGHGACVGRLVVKTASVSYGCREVLFATVRGLCVSSYQRLGTVIVGWDSCGALWQMK